MNVERAAEVILNGEAWEDCVECFGAGHLNLDNGPCDECFGRGVILNLDYALACSILNKPLPEFERPNYILYKDSPGYDRVMADVERLTAPHVAQNIFNIPSEGHTTVDRELVLIMGSFPYDD